MLGAWHLQPRASQRESEVRARNPSRNARSLPARPRPDPAGAGCRPEVVECSGMNTDSMALDFTYDSGAKCRILQLCRKNPKPQNHKP